MVPPLGSAELRDQLEQRGYGLVPGALDARACAELIGAYDDDPRFRSTIVMERHGYGRGEYRYFRYPLPPVVEALRRALYAALAPTAGEWAERLGLRAIPPSLDQMRELCRAHGQSRPTPLLLRYRAGDFNALHQDVYGEIVFPLQATVLLSDPADFTGGEFVLTESRPRRQSVAHVVPLDRGDLVVFPNSRRPNAHGGRSVFRHGVAEVRSGSRVTLGVILHDAQ